ncbi:MAG: hypothetical protein [Wendovervirus sonii]|uniref:DUF1566 domain-containing protein n=1 Tax=phage Lak_Megaphage_Sonny TaxID=3109229 RepID=A0ABZ0Z3X7_9CAUD|nr:MAG: hypothetical protein [phage Lak_Megaphage_Sonny]
MKNLYKKLYEAINTGIQKALVLNDEDDVSIIYQHKKLANNSNVISYFVDELLQGSNNEYNYEKIIKYYEETGYKYELNNFEELRIIFNKIKNFKNVSFEWLENMKDYISIVLENNSEINFYEETNKKPLFLKFANDDIVNTENEILIYLYEDHYIPEKDYPWGTKEKQIQPVKYCINDENIAEKDYSGYENCLRIQDIVQSNPKKYGETPAINYCLNLNNIKGYHGYLPSIGQLKILSDNIDMINYIFNYLKLNEIEELNEIEDFNESWWWSSTEAGYYYTWDLHYGYPYSGYEIGRYLSIFPLFAVRQN